jgi:predicted AAA+ superfamily ATPase
MIRLCPATIGSRDSLPYTSEFDAIYEKFLLHADRNLTKNEFWRALSKTAKASRKPTVVDVNPSNTLSGDLIHLLYQMNPWWNNDTPLDVPKFRRSIFEILYKRLTDRKAGHKPFLGLRGPRQVGKSTVMEQLIQTLIYENRLVSPQHILRVQFDAPGMQLKNPILTITRWFEESVVKNTFNSLWKQHKPVFLFFDEVQDVPEWSLQLKTIIDFQMCKALITGSSALRILKGQESLPGRLDTYNLNPLSLPEVAGLQNIKFRPSRKPVVYSDLAKKEFWEELSGFHHLFLDDTFKSYCDLGGYPYCHTVKGRTLAERNVFLKNNVTVRTIDHDLGVGVGRGASISKSLQNNTLLRKIFVILCKYTGKSVTIGTLHSEIVKDTGDSINNDQLYELLDFFDNSMLIRIIKTSQHRYAGAKTQVKPCLCDHSIRAAWLEDVSLYESTPNSDMAGGIVEGMVGYLLSSIDGISVSYLPPKGDQKEIDYIIEIGDKHIPVEVKYQNDLPRQFDAIEHYLDKPVNNASFGIVVTKTQSEVKERIIAIPFKTFLLLQ